MTSDTIDKVSEKHVLNPCKKVFVHLVIKLVLKEAYNQKEKK